MTFNHHIATVNGVQLHYVKAGFGKPVVLLHGWPQTWHEWRQIIPQLAEQYTVIAPDLRGLGDSEISSTGYDKKTVAEDIHQLVCQLKLDSIYLVAHDMGVPVAYAYTSLYPEEIQRLVVLDVPPPTLDAVINLWHINFHMIPELPEILVSNHVREYLLYFYGDAYPDAISEADLQEYVRCYSQYKSLSASFEYYRSFHQDIQDNQKFAQTLLKMPVLVLHGERSPLGNAAEIVMRALAENVTSDVVPNCGHWIAEEQPDVLVEKLRSFLPA